MDETLILGSDFNCREIDWVRHTSNGPRHCHKLLDIILCNDFSLNQMNDIPEYAIKKLQRVQNLAARVVTRSSKYSSITPTLKKLHWLPVKYRIIFKVVLLTFKALHGLAPTYLRTLLQSYIPSRSLRSETGNLLIMPKARRKLGCQRFAVAAAKLWNDLPVNIRTTTSIVSFRSSLKTHLFKLAYA